MCIRDRLDSDQQDTVQASYRLRIVQGGDVVWDSGTVASAQSILNEYLCLLYTSRCV